jgi:hypothetical protein
MNEPRAGTNLSYPVDSKFLQLSDDMPIELPLEFLFFFNTTEPFISFYDMIMQCFAGDAEEEEDEAE